MSVPTVVIKMPFEGAVTITVEGCNPDELDALAHSVWSNPLRTWVIAWASIAAGHDRPDLDHLDDQDDPE